MARGQILGQIGNKDPQLCGDAFFPCHALRLTVPTLLAGAHKVIECRSLSCELLAKVRAYLAQVQTKNIDRLAN